MYERQATTIPWVQHQSSIVIVIVVIVVIIIAVIVVIIIAVIIVIIIVIFTTRLHTGWVKPEQGAMTTIGARLFVFSRWAIVDVLQVGQPSG